MPAHTFHRTLKIDPVATHQTILDGLPSIKDVSVTNGSNPITFLRKRRTLANRHKMTGTAAFDGNQLTVVIDGAGSMQEKFASEIFELLPEDSVDDHGLTEAIAHMDKSARVFGAAELTGLINDMQPGENVQMIVSGNVEGGLAIMILTNLRLLIKDRKALSSETEEINPRQITSVSTGKKMGGETLKLTVSGKTLEMTTIMHGRGAEMANLIRRAQTEQAKPSAAPASAPEDPTEQIRKLAELHAAGVLTDDEFAAAKAKALGL